MKKFLVPIALAGLLALPALAQLDTGIIEGTVKDASGAAIPNAAVTITETQTNLHYPVTSDAKGDYVSPPLKVGVYSVSVAAPGFKQYTRSGIVLNVQDRLHVDAPLEVGGQTEQVIVTGEVPPIQTDTSALGQVLSAQEVEDMPLNGRNYLGLVNLTAGVVGNGTSFSSNGVRTDMNNFILDGVDNNSNDNGNTTLPVNLDAISEFKIQTSSYDAEFGRAGGAAINVVIKSGTNQIHGSAFFFYQNAYLNAESFFATTRPLSTKYNQPGATFGFPIIKNKLFFFGDWQFTDQHTPVVDKSTVPTLAEKIGDFSAADNPGITGLKTIYDPNTINAAGVRTPYPNQTIPASEISPIGQAYANLYPAPNVAGATKSNYIYEPTGLTQTMEGDGRADYRISDVDSAFARYTQVGQTTVGAPKMPGLACGCSYSTGNTFQPRMGASVGETHIFTPTTLNEFRAGFNWYYQHVGVPNGGYVPLPSQYAIPGVTTDPSFQGTPNMAPSSYSSLGLATDTPTWLSTSERQIRDTLNLVRGRHTIRLGGEFRWSQFNLFQLEDLRGQFSFTGQYSSISGASGGNGLADMLLGIPLTSLIDTYTYLGNRQHVPALFVQDDFKIAHNLTLNLGLRYEYYSPIVDVHNHLANFDYTTGQLITAGQNGNSDSLSTSQKDNFAPRLGLAYTPFSKTVFRAAYGIFYTGQEDRTGDPTQLQYNLPFYYQPTFVGNGVTPVITLAKGFPALNPSQAIDPGAASLDWFVKTPYFQEWNATVQRALPGAMSVEVAYVGMKGVHLESVTDQNQVVTPGAGLVQPRRPYPFYSGFASLQMRGNSEFDSLQVKVDKHLGHGLYFLSSLTFGKAMDDLGAITNGVTIEDSYDLKLAKAPSSFYRKATWVTSFDYLLPFGRGTSLLNGNRVVDLLVGGWHLTGIYTMTTGAPLTPTMSYDSSNTGTQGSDLPNRLSNGNLSGSQRSLYEWFNVNAFVDDPTYSFGNSGYGVIIGPGVINLDMSLRKIFSITERQKLQLRIDVFNAPNHPNFGNPGTGIDNGPGSAGTITSVGAMRVTQLGLKYQF